MLAAGVSLYVRTTRARNRIGYYVFVAYVGLLLVVYVGDRFSGPSKCCRPCVDRYRRRVSSHSMGVVVRPPPRFAHRSCCEDVE